MFFKDETPINLRKSSFILCFFVVSGKNGTQINGNSISDLWVSHKNTEGAAYD